MILATLTSRIEESDKREHHIPFEIKVEDPFYSTSNQLHLVKSIKQLKDGKGSAHDLIEDYDE